MIANRGRALVMRAMGLAAAISACAGVAFGVGYTCDNNRVAYTEDTCQICLTYQESSLGDCRWCCAHFNPNVGSPGHNECRLNNGC